MNTKTITIKILISSNKNTNEMYDVIVLGDEDSSDRYIQLKYHISDFSLDELYQATSGFSLSTQEYCVDKYQNNEDFYLEYEAWDLPSIGTFEVKIIEKLIEI